MLNGPSWFQKWLDEGQEPCGEWDEEGDRNGEPAENYDLGCMVLMLLTTVCLVATCVIVVVAALRLG